MIYAIGDIHGRISLLQPLLDALRTEWTDEDHVVFIGDYVDRGEDSRAVIETLFDLKRSRPGTVFLRGNHEQLMLEAMNGPAPEPSLVPGLILHSEQTLNWLQNGGVQTLISYDVADFLRWTEFIPPDHRDFIESTQIEYVTERFRFVHAGLLPPLTTWEGADWFIEPRLWIREPFLSSDYNFDDRIVVFGHTPQRNGVPLVHANKIGIDTAAAYGGPLTCVVLDDGGAAEPTFIQVHPE